MTTSINRSLVHCSCQIPVRQNDLAFSCYRVSKCNVIKFQILEFRYEKLMYIFEERTTLPTFLPTLRLL